MSYYDLTSTEGIMDMADTEAGPSCEEEEYQRLRAIMVASPALLAAAESVMAWWEAAQHETYIGIGGEWPWYSQEPEFVSEARIAIALAAGESPCSQK